MRKFLMITFCFLAYLAFAQEKEVIRLKGSIPNNGDGDYNSLIVIDKRADKTIGFLPFGDNRAMKEVSFENSSEKDLSEWYRKSNLKGGKQELILVIEDLKLTVKEMESKNNMGKLDFSFQSFVKEDDSYRFLFKKDTVFWFQHKDVSNKMAKNLPYLFAAYLDKTYKMKPQGENLSLENINDYANYVRAYPAFTNDLKDGIYLNHNAFFRQIPEEGNFAIEKNTGGEISRAIKTENGKKIKINASKIVFFVENGKAYRNTYSGFYEVKKNGKGFYIETKPQNLFPANYNVNYGMMFGLIGGIADALLQQKRMLGMDMVQEVYIDPMTGEYDFKNEEHPLFL